MDLAPITLELPPPKGVARLVPMHEDHAPALLEASDDALWAYMTSPPPANADEMLTWMRVGLDGHTKGTNQPWVIQHVPTGRIIGTTRYLDIQHQHRAVEIGFTWITADFRRTPINTQCKFLLLRHAFETLNCLRVQLKTDGRNIRSQDAMTRIGAVREGTHRRHRVLWNGYIRDTAYFSVTDLDWPAVKQNLVRMMDGGTGVPPVS